MTCVRVSRRIFVVAIAVVVAGAFSLRAASAAFTAGQATPAAPAVAKVVTGALDLNSATKEMMMAIPGVDDAQAQKIIDGRPYRSRTELTKRNIIPLDLYNKIKSKITVKPIKK